MRRVAGSCELAQFVLLRRLSMTSKQRLLAVL